MGGRLSSSLISSDAPPPPGSMDLISERQFGFLSQCEQIWPQRVMSPGRRFGDPGDGLTGTFSLSLLPRPFLEAMDAICWSRSEGKEGSGGNGKYQRKTIIGMYLKLSPHIISYYYNCYYYNHWRHTELWVLLLISELPSPCAPLSK